MILGVQDLEVGGKRVLVRVDFNVPQNELGEITDDTRIRAALPTIRNVLERGGQPILMSHLGRPKGLFNEKLTLKPVAVRLAQLLETPVAIAPDCVGPAVEALIAEGGVVLLENLRFHKAETKPDSDPNFAHELAALGQAYVNDAFGTAHRAHSSTVQLPLLFPGKAAAGLLIQKEIAFLGNALLSPKRPFVAIVGGAKVSTKMGIIKALAAKADQLLIGGGMAYTFLKGKGVEVGHSLLEPDLVAKTKGLGDNILLPIDIVAAATLEEGVDTEILEVEKGIPPQLMGLDVGPRTIEKWAEILADAKTILWNGPVGAFEIQPFDKGTFALAQILAKSQATTIIGGGDSVAAVNQAGLAEQMSHMSTGGGASLEYIERDTLPGLEALSKK